MKRVISGIVGLAVLFSVTLSPPIVLQIGVALVAVIGLLEMYRALNLTKKSVLPVLGLYFAGLTMACMENILPMDWNGTYILFFIGFLFSCMICVLKYGTVHFTDVVLTFMISVMLPLFFGAIPYVRGYSDGHFLIYYIFACAWAPDTLAYFFGKFFGKKKLCPVLSPKKTVAGSIGGVLGGVLGGAILYAVLYFAFGYGDFTLPMALGFGFLAGIVSQFGDLTFSSIKRDFNIKDYGTIMPGHGGVMDRFDSIVFVAPCFVAYLWLM